MEKQYFSYVQSGVMHLKKVYLTQILLRNYVDDAKRTTA